MQSTSPIRPLAFGWKPEKVSSGPATKNEALTQSLCYLTDNDHVLIMGRAKQQTFSKGEPLIKQGMPSPAFYIVRSGNARVERNGQKLAMIGAGNVCGEMTLLEDSAASASVIAEMDMVVDAVEVRDMKAVFDSFPNLASRFYRSIALNLSRKLRATSSQLTLALEKNAQAK